MKKSSAPKNLFLRLSIAASVSMGLLFAGAYWLHSKYAERPSQFPLPYSFEKTPFFERNLDSDQDIGKALAPLKSHVVVIGDTLAKHMGQGTNYTQLGQAGAGLHRTLHLLQKYGAQLKDRTLILLTGHDENYEKRFVSDDIPVIVKNFSLYNDPIWKTFLQKLPQLGRLLYQKVTQVPMAPAPQRDTFPYSEAFYMRIINVQYKLFQVLLEKIIALTQKHQAQLILVTVPLDLVQPPRHSCKLATTPSAQAKQMRILKKIEAGQFKEVFSELTSLAEALPGNAMTYYLLGQAQILSGSMEKGRENLEYATTLECQFWRSNAIINQILLKMATRYEVKLLDAHQVIWEDLGPDGNFTRDHLPNRRASQYIFELLEKNFL